MKRILITGGSGFIGTNLVEFYRLRGNPVCNVDVAPVRNPEHADFHKQVDILDAAALREAVDTFAPDIIFHLAARTDLDGRTLEDYSANIEGVTNVLEAVRGCNTVQRLIVASSRLVCRIGYQPTSDTDYQPTTVYGRSKIRTEQIVRAFGLEVPWTIVRPTSIWGPWFGVPYDLFFRLIGRGMFVLPGRRKVLKSFGFVGNSVHELDCLSTADSTIDGTTRYLCDYPPLELEQWAHMIRDAMDAPPLRRVPFGLLKTVAVAGDVMASVPLPLPTPPLTSFRLNNLVAEMVHDTAPIERVAGTLPYSLEQGVAQTVEWIKRS